MIISRSILVAANGIISFFSYDRVLFLCMYVSHFPYPVSVDWHISCSRVMDIVNSAEMNTGVHVPFPMTIFSKYMPRRGTGGSYGSSSFIF